MKGHATRVSLILGVLIVGLVLLGVGYYFGFDIGFEKAVTQMPPQKISSFEECIAAGNPVLESYPEQCRTIDGKSFTRDIGNEMEVRNLITISNPRPNQKITSPLAISGEAVGNWFFEASFPVELQDANGNKIGEGFATAEGEWMTTDFVPFKAELTFEKPTTQKGKLILRKDNPSGLPENDNQLIVPVLF